MQVNMHMLMKRHIWSRDCRESGNPAPGNRRRAQTRGREGRREGGGERTRGAKSPCGSRQETGGGLGRSHPEGSA